MAGWNGSGVFSRTYNWVQDQLNGILIRADRHDANDTDFVNGINNCLTKDGQNAPTANLPMGTFKHLNVGKAALYNQYVTAEQLLENELTYYTTSGTDTYTITPSPSVTAYTAGLGLKIKIGTTNTGAATLNVNGLGAKTIKTSAGAAVTAGTLLAGSIVDMTYDGTDFIIGGAINKIAAFTSGTIDNTTIGATTPAAGTFSGLNVSSTSPIYQITDTNAGANATITKIYTSSAGRLEMATFTDADASNTIFYQAVRSGANITDINHTVNSGSHNFLGGAIVGVPSFPSAESLTVASGVITVTSGKNVATILGEGGAADSLDTISGGVARGIYRFSAGSSSQDITFKHGTGNILLSGNQDWTTLTTSDSILFYFDGSNYRELSKFYSGAASPLVRGFIRFNGSGTPAITSQYNVTSITDNNTGDYTLNHTNAMPSANYCVTGIAKAASASVTANVSIDSANAPTTTACRIGVHNDAGTKVDATDIHITFIGG
jgi:hypothetical protein